MTFFKTLDDMKVFYFSFLVQRFKSAKKILKPAGASRKFWSLLDFRWHESFLFLVSSAALQKRQENFEACWSVKNIWSPAGATKKFWSL